MRSGKRHLAALLLAALVCAAALAQAEGLYEGPGWATPEEAAQVYLEGLREQDLDRMISAYAVETFIDQADLEALLLRMGSYTWSLIPAVPNASPLVRDINIESRRNEITRSALWQMQALCLPERDFTKPVGFSGEDRERQTRDFVEELDTALGAVDLSGLTVISFSPPEDISDVYASSANQENLRAQAAVYGADELRGVVALFTVDGKIGAYCCDAARYGDLWYLFRSGGNIAMLIGFSASSGGLVAGGPEALAEIRGTLTQEEQARLDAVLAEAFPDS